LEENDTMKNEEMLIEILGNKSSRAILSLTSRMECSAIQLCHELGIPLTTVYRKLKVLEDTGLIKHVKTIINLSGNEEKYYRCVINAVTVNFNRGMLDVSLQMEDCNDKIVRLWKRFTLPEASELRI
jgi:predicted transcriptional regulator